MRAGNCSEAIASIRLTRRFPRGIGSVSRLSVTIQGANAECPFSSCPLHLAAAQPLVIDRACSEGTSISSDVEIRVTLIVCLCMARTGGECACSPRKPHAGGLAGYHGMRCRKRHLSLQLLQHWHRAGAAFRSVRTPRGHARGGPYHRSRLFWRSAIPG